MTGQRNDRIRSELPRRRVPVILVSGVQDSAMSLARISLQFGLPDAVAVCHAIDPERQMLIRVVSDVTGIIERKEINLAHACVTCAIREDIVPTLERLGALGRWGAIVASLPVAAEAKHVCRLLAGAPDQAPHVAIASVVAAFDGTSMAEDLLGGDTLEGRGLATSRDDERGVAEVACAIVEYADVVCLTQVPDPDESALIGLLARPRVPVISDPSLLDAPLLVSGVRRHEPAEAWVTEVRRGALPPVPAGRAWRLDLCSQRPFHPQRFQDTLAALGHGPRRSRGCFWLPTRPDTVCVWDGAGGYASIGPAHQWGHEQPLTRITVIGIDDAREGRAALVAAFHKCLLTDDEAAAKGLVWKEYWDGLEPWLGPIERVA